ncbi:MAG: hypothetical protein A2X42_04575 [Candidatus Margulisbacteria bacterium GWF2_38_17]|nr:MAG: hypothetical protein A2X43_11290 [Candidatus Margulisbacteria bacterium GWD2_39_127]OGI04173.1 MAG: hypothetical protein A2X42_04575 [Candidatus Margulisbacteria bacterium GWF2_38_17]OGI09303.1 MAG: hypothetical protein A2X41_09260 [Candidatus Margulisbacteria bacterium GWE2_39_32]
MADTEKKQILIIDDDKNIVIALKYYLSLEGYDVLAASNGNHAFQLLNTNTPDLILLDIKMPVMNGYLFSQMLKTKEKYKNIPIILITATPNMTGGIQLHSNCDDILKKPFNNEDLLKKIHKHLVL